MRNKITGLTLCLFDLLSLFLAVLMAGFLAKFINENILETFYGDINQDILKQRLKTFLFEAIVVIFIFFNRGHYSRFIPWWSQVRYVMLVVVVMLVIDGFIYFVLKSQFSRLWTVLTWVNACAFLLIGRYLAKCVCSYFSMWKIPTIVIGDRRNVIDILYALSAESSTFDVSAIILSEDNSISVDELPETYQKSNILYLNKNETLAHLKQNKDAFYVLAPDNFKEQRIDKLILSINEFDSKFVLVPPLEGAPLYGAIPQYFFGHDVMFLFSRKNVNSPFGKFIKRSIDILGAIVGLVCFSPLFIIIAILIKKDGGNILFAQPRVGKGDKSFKCLKFRTMWVDAEERLNSLLQSDKDLQEEWDKKQKLDNDPRITTIGEILRKTSLDEIPQFINILKGEMSLVGPRPILADQKELYKEQINDYMSVKPGLTGLWQVSGRSTTSFAYKIHLDSWYVNNWSLWNDFVILCKTVVITITRKGAC